jgi:hypothetical protein
MHRSCAWPGALLKIQVRHVKAIRLQGEGMTPTKKPIGSQPVDSAWRRVRAHHVGVCADWLYNPARVEATLHYRVRSICVSSPALTVTILTELGVESRV